MTIQLQDVNEGDLLKAATVLYDEKPVLDFELHEDYYVVDWDSAVEQEEFFNYLKRLKCPPKTSVIIQSESIHPDKTTTTLGEALQTKDRVTFLYFDTDDFGMTWYVMQNNREKIEFSSRNKNAKLLTDMLNQTAGGLGDLVRRDIEETLQNYRN